MKRLLIATLVLTASAAQAQQSGAQSKIEAYIGRLIIENATLASQTEDLSKQVQELQKQLAEFKAKEPKKD